MDPTKGAQLVDYSQYLALLLPLAGMSLQYMRGSKAIKERWTVFAALGIAIAVYALCMDWTALPRGAGAVQKSLLDGLVWLGAAVPSVLGGTFAASKSASAGMPVFPVTNSKQ